MDMVYIVLPLFFVAIAVKLVDMRIDTIEKKHEGDIEFMRATAKLDSQIVYNYIGKVQKQIDTVTETVDIMEGTIGMIIKGDVDAE